MFFINFNNSSLTYFKLFLFNKSKIKMSRRKFVLKKENLEMKTKNSEKLKKNIHFITYGDEKYERSKNRLLNEAKIFFDFKTYNAYGKDDLDSEFRKKYSNILNQNRGGGYWIWKPYLILKKLEEIDEGDYLIYLDAGCSLNPKGFDRFLEYIDMLDNSEKSIISFSMNHIPERNYTNDNIFKYFNLPVDSDIGNSGQIIATILLMKKNKHVIEIFEFVMKILKDDCYLFTDKYNKETKRPEFVDNRHDQSIMSIVRKIKGSIVLEDETWWKEGFGRGKSLSYPFWATRKK